MLEIIKMERMKAIRQEIRITSQRSCRIIFHKFFISGLSGFYHTTKVSFKIRKLLSMYIRIEGLTYQESDIIPKMRVLFSQKRIKPNL